MEEFLQKFALEKDQRESQLTGRRYHGRRFRSGRVKVGSNPEECSLRSGIKGKGTGERERKEMSRLQLLNNKAAFLLSQLHPYAARGTKIEC